MKIDNNITHTPKAIPTNAILTIGTDTARVPSPFNNLRAIKNSKFTNLVAFIHYTKVLFSIQFDKIKGFCFTNLYVPRILRKIHLPGHSRIPCPRHFPYPHKTLRFPHFPDRRFKGFPLSSVRQNTTIIPAVTGQHVFRIKGKNFLPSNFGYNLRRFHLPQKQTKTSCRKRRKIQKKLKYPKIKNNVNMHTKINCVQF